MPRKHVHFSDDSSPSFTTVELGPDSAPSSSGPITPSGLPRKLSGPSVHVHPIIQSSSIILNWDLRDPPATIRLVSCQTLTERVTDPPLLNFTIRTPSFPWTIDVYASNGFYVTLGDVFDSVYRSLRKGVSQAEFFLLAAYHQQRTVRAYTQRCKRRDNGEKERMKGIKRIDFLTGNTRFLGISLDRRNEWLLNLGPTDPANSESSAYFQAPSLPRSIILQTPMSESPAALGTTSLLPPAAQTSLPSPTSHVEETGEHLRDTPLLVEQSAHMFEQAHNVIISGGEFYNAAGSMNIDNSHSIDASIRPTHITHMWHHHHASNQVLVTPDIKEQALQTERLEADQRRNMRSSPLEAGCSHSVIDYTTLLDESELENQHSETIQDAIITLPTACYADQSLTDEVICDILSNYPPLPIGNYYLFSRIVKAFLSSFSPLSPAMIAVLFNLDGVQHVKHILLPAYPLIIVPESGDDEDEDEDRTPVRFIHPSITGFFLDRSRSGRYFVDTPTAHRVLLEGSTSVMRKVHEEGQRLDSMGRGWRDAYDYACRYWEAHRRAGTRSKL